jgi:hypothetical protein
MKNSSVPNIPPYALLLSPYPIVNYTIVHRLN